VVGFTEAARLENADAGIEFSIVMPGVVKTDMIAGYEDARGVRQVEPEDVGRAVAAALEHPRVDVWVPRALGPTYHLTSALPRRLREAAMRVLKVDRVTWEADRSKRADYEARAAASEPSRSARDDTAV
jgi:short-subunit dehydrogenase